MGQRARQKSKGRKQRKALAAPESLAGKAIQQLKERLEVTEPIIEGPLGPKKLADVIYDYAEPLFEGVFELEDIQNALRFGVVLWNLSFLPEEQRNNFLCNQTTIIEAEQLEKFAELVHLMVERRRSFFTDYPYLVTDYEIVGKDSSVDFAVKYAPLDDAVTPSAIGY